MPRPHRLYLGLFYSIKRQVAKDYLDAVYISLGDKVRAGGWGYWSILFQKWAKGIKKTTPYFLPLTHINNTIVMVHKGAGDLKDLWVELLAVAVVVGDFVVVTVTVLDGVTDHDIVAVTERDVVAVKR